MQIPSLDMHLLVRAGVPVTTKRSTRGRTHSAFRAKSATQCCSFFALLLIETVRDLFYTIAHQALHPLMYFHRLKSFRPTSQIEVISTKQIAVQRKAIFDIATYLQV